MRDVGAALVAARIERSSMMRFLRKQIVGEAITIIACGDPGRSKACPYSFGPSRLHLQSAIELRV
jgi:hypothetical protein